ncbi:MULTISPECIES: GIY-YIG nuclease family protein [unclassified Olsenella]|uniref:GIY-YIG nuclease family protein n=1 Tax=unclassified Olsenella TaxID=2638792 RepID=UPI000E5565CF|nr:MULTISPECIES: GIY-YIG nuclease family protein [unclassified Olsenella]RGS52462.1 GIY-YIG nuclease family protein [Olsenella sp. AF21-51]RHB57295.1 GIY-YIG nuclease family protein [Olsenella sp. AM39-30AC]
MAQHKTMTTQFIDGEPDGLRLCNCAGSLITTVYMPRTHLSRAHQLDLPSRGVYYLLKVDSVRIERLYVGQTTQGINRLNDHNQKKPWWDRAVLFLSDDSNNFTLDTAIGLEKYAIERTTEAFPDIAENKVAPKYKINKFQRPFIESLFGEIRFMMATFGLPVDGTDAKHIPPQATAAKPEPNGEVATGVPVRWFVRQVISIEDI